LTLGRDEGYIRAEQLQLVLNGIGQSGPIGLLLASLLVWVLLDTAPADALWGWYGCFVAGRLTNVGFARHTLRRGYGHADLGRLVNILVILKFVEGLTWAALVWISLDTATPGQRTLLIALMAAISGNGVSLLSPILRIYLALIVPALLLVAAKLWMIGGQVNGALAICCFLYVTGQIGQARLSCRSIRESISLRFENLDLIERLRVESIVASEAREEAEQANLAKSKFLAAASHDLRQPIHALGLFLNVLSRSPLDAVQRQVLENANAASLASAEMLNTLLDFSRIEAGVVHPKPRPCALQTLLNKLESELAHQADAKGLIYRTRETRLVAHSDPALLELILRNLVSNAIRYTERGGILVGCRRRPGHAWIEVYDTGIGIAPDQQREVFREFYQLGNPERDRRKGLGLGLAITEGLARSLGHGLSLASIPGRGSVFRISVPLAARAPVDAAPLPWPATEPLDGPDPLMAGRTVLVLDDDETVRLGMQHLLADWGCTCIAVDALEDACAMAWPEPPAAIICDYRLRDRQSGADAIQALRRYFDRDIPALLVTGDTAPERLREAASSGVPLLHKPVPAAQLQQALRQLLASPAPLEDA
jgi:signal transduction histidine kinase/ActR/RegA family two-component response regulator